MGTGASIGGESVARVAPASSSPKVESQIRPQIRRDYALNLSISLRAGKETN